MKKVKVFFSILLILSMITCSNAIFTKDIAQAASSVSLNNRTLVLELGHYKTLRVYGTSRKASWSSSNSWIASVNSNGKVSAKAAGTATITAKVAGKRLTCKVTVLRLKDKAVTMASGSTKQLVVQGTKSPITWTSNNEGVATVNNDGKVTAKAIGTATITALVNGKQLTSKITVLDITPKSFNLEYGHTFGFLKTLKVTGTTSKITWSSSNESVATVSSSGRVTAHGAGSATITANVNGAKLTSKVNVFVISAKEFTLASDETKTLEIYGTKSPITWTSNKRSVAIVSEDGIVIPIAPGTATITGYVEGRKLTAEVTVEE